MLAGVDSVTFATTKGNAERALWDSRQAQNLKDNRW